MFRAFKILGILVFLSACTPEPELVFHDGTTAPVQEYRARWLVVNFWATWCGPCIREIPELNDLAEQLDSRVAVLGVNADALRGEELSQAMQALDVAFPVVQDGAHYLVPQVMQGVLPSTWVLSPNQQEHLVLRGEQSAKNLLRALDQLGYSDEEGEVL